MRMRFLALAAALLTVMAAAAQDDPVSPQASPNPIPGQRGGPGGGQGRGRGWGGGWMNGRGVAGTVSEVASDHYTIKTSTGETYTVHYSVNSRIILQPAQRTGAGAMRVPPQEIKAADIHVGDVIMAMGEVDLNAKAVGAMSVVKLDPARAREMKEMQANFGKTWLIGKVKAVNDTKVTLESPVDNAEHTFVADENTTFRRRRVPITLADIQPGANVRVDGAVNEGVFIASSVILMGPPGGGPPSEGPAPPEGAAPPPQ
jgi:hypothetical protein